MSMKKSILILLFIWPSLMLLAQSGKYMTKSGHIYFISHTSIIDIDANHHQVGSMLDTNTGQLVFSLLMKSFEFTLPMAEEHFNENYVESHKYPKASFSGVILKYKTIDFTELGKKEVVVKGKLSIHGITKEIEEEAVLEIKKDKIVASCDFSIKLADYMIKVPKIVDDKVSKVIPISVKMNYFPYN